MLCVQIFLPSNQRNAADARRLVAVQRELTERYGGVTAFVNTPAQGAWRKDRRTIRDRIVVVEVMVPRLGRTWWKRYRRELEARFEQDEIVIRAIRMELL